MDLVYDGLKSVTVRADDYETLMVSLPGPHFARLRYTC